MADYQLTQTGAEVQAILDAVDDIQSDVGELQSALDGKVNTTDIATTSDLGLVKPDGSTITIDADGTIHSASSELVFLQGTVATGTIANSANWSKAVKEVITIPTGYTIASISPMITGSYSTYVDVHIVGLNGDFNNPAVVLVNRSGNSVSLTVAVYVIAKKG